MKNQPQAERTLVLIKPDGVQRTLVGEIIKRYERTGLKLVGLKFLVPSPKLVERHYLLEPGWLEKTGEKSIQSYLTKGLTPPSRDPQAVGRRVLGFLTRYLTSGPVVALVWQGAHAVQIVRKLTGGTEPLCSDVGTIRGDFVIDSYALSDTTGRSVRNLVHASSSVAEARAEIKLWFTPRELVSYGLVQEKILYDVNLDGILE
jgi:nucleoside-diphosphate kinase